jgi:hypothetical protein
MRIGQVLVAVVAAAILLPLIIVLAPPLILWRLVWGNVLRFWFWPPIADKDASSCSSTQTARTAELHRGERAAKARQSRSRHKLVSSQAMESGVLVGSQSIPLLGW